MVTQETSVELGLTQTSWLGRYRWPRVLQRRGALVVASTYRVSDGAPCVVLAPGPGADPARATEEISSIERAHRSVRDAAVPGIAGRGTFLQRPFLELECDATLDGAELHRLVTDARRRAPLPAGFAFASKLFGALRAVHEARDPRSRRPLCLGGLSYSDILFAPSGHFYLILFGHPGPEDKPSGSTGAGAPTFLAPDVAQGGEPSPTGDHVALHLLLRSLFPLLDLGQEVVRFLHGDLAGACQELVDCLRWPEVHMVGGPPSRRAPPAAAESMSARLQQLCGVTPDPEGLAAFVRQSIQGDGQPVTGGAGGRPVLVLGVETSWTMGPDGQRYMLGQAHRRIVTALADLHRRSSGAVLTMHELLEAGWPGERPIPEAGANRVYVALTQLRQKGLRDLIERRDGGYRLVPDVQIRLAT